MYVQGRQSPGRAIVRECSVGANRTKLLLGNAPATALIKCDLVHDHSDPYWRVEIVISTLCRN